MPLRTHADEPPSINLTPMIDVVFLLIIFFMVGAKFTSPERKIELEVPRVADAGALSSAPAKRVVNVFQTGQITLDDEPVSLNSLINRLSHSREQYADLGVLVRGDAEARHQQMAEVLNACRRAGIEKLAISVKPTTVQ